MDNFKYTKAERLSRELDFRRTFKQGKRIHCGFFDIRYRPNHLEKSRLGIACSRKAGPPVSRNQIKRTVREWFRQNKHSLTAHLDIIFFLGHHVQPQY